MEHKTDLQAKEIQDEREAVRKKTFTRWINVFLQRCEPPIVVQDLFTDIQDGHVLMALLEELSGHKLLYRFRPSSHYIFRLNNIAKALAFLDDRHVKLLGIDASGIADGLPSVVLNLIWNIILYFQIKRMTGGLRKHLSSSLSSSLSSLPTNSYPSSSDLSSQPSDSSTYSSSTLPSKGRKAARTSKYQGKAIKALLHWVQRCTSKFGVEVHDFGKSWTSGMAFLAMIKSIDPGLVDLRDSLFREARENTQEALRIAKHSLGLPPLLDPEDVVHHWPDEQSIITYVSMFLEHYSDLDEDCAANFGRSISIPEIPSFKENLTCDLDDQIISLNQQKTTEQLLWKKWSMSLRESHPASPLLPVQKLFYPSKDENTGPLFNLRGDVKGTDLKNDDGNYVSVIQPNSPLGLEIDTMDQEIWTWMENVTTDPTSSQINVDEGHCSQSSEEGVYNLSILDSDEEDAFSYILDLNRDVPQSSLNQFNRKAPGVAKEMTAETLCRNSQQAGESEAENAFDISANATVDCNPERQEVVAVPQDNVERAFMEIAAVEQDQDQGQIGAKKMGGCVQSDNWALTEGSEGRDGVFMYKVREAINNSPSVCGADKGLKGEVEERQGGDRMVYELDKGGGDRDEEEEEQEKDREIDRERVEGEERSENREVNKENLKEGDAYREGRTDGAMNCAEGENVIGKDSDEEEWDVEEEDTDMKGARDREDEEVASSADPGSHGDEGRGGADNVFGEGAVKRTGQIVEFRERFDDREGLTIIEDNLGEGFDKSELRQTAEKGEEEEGEKDEIWSRELSDEEELREGADKEIAAGDLEDAEQLKEEEALKDHEADEKKTDLRGGEEEAMEQGEEGGKKMREVEEVRWEEQLDEDEEGEGGDMNEEKEEERVTDVAKSIIFKAENQDVRNCEVRGREEVTFQIKSVLGQDRGIGSGGQRVVGKGEEAEEEEIQEGVQDCVSGTAVIKVGREEENVSLQHSRDGKGREEQENGSTTSKDNNEMVALEHMEEGEQHKFITLGGTAEGATPSEVSLGENVSKTQPNLHHHHHNINPDWTSTGSFLSARDENEFLDLLASSCGLARSELEWLLASWMLLYCFFILTAC